MHNILSYILTNKRIKYILLVISVFVIKILNVNFYTGNISKFLNVLKTSMN